MYMQDDNNNNNGFAKRRWIMGMLKSVKRRVARWLVGIARRLLVGDKFVSVSFDCYEDSWADNKEWINAMQLFYIRRREGWNIGSNWGRMNKAEVDLTEEMRRNIEDSQSKEDDHLDFNPDPFIAEEFDKFGHSVGPMFKQEGA